MQTNNKNQFKSMIKDLIDFVRENGESQRNTAICIQSLEAAETWGIGEVELNENEKPSQEEPGQVPQTPDAS